METFSRMTSTGSLLLFADSKNRDGALYPSGNSYVLHLTRPIKNIERVDLVSARVPNTMWNCTQGSNVFSTDTSNVSINPGFYSAYTLAQDVTAQQNSLTLTYLPEEGHYIFSSSSPFTLTPNSSEFATMVGLTQGKTYASVVAPSTYPNFTGKFIVKSVTLVNMSLNEYVYLDIDELRTPFNVDTGSIQGTTGTISGSNANRSFAPIMLDVGSACIKNFHENKDYRISVDYPEPINSLQRLTVRWVDKNGDLLDFRGWNTNAFILRLYLKPDPEPTLPPPRPLEEIQIKRIVEAMMNTPPPPVPEKRKIPWVWIIVALVLGVVAWKTFRPSSVGPGQGAAAPGPPRLQVPVRGV